MANNQSIQDPILELTGPQMKVWAGQMRTTNAPLYNMVLTFDLFGCIDVEQFGESFRKLCDQVDVLRLVLILDGELPKQQFLSNVPVAHRYLDLSAEQTAKSQLDSWIRKNKERLFQPGEVLYDSVLFKLAEEHFVWYFNHHHLITDGATVMLLYDRLANIYQGNLSDQDYSHSYQNIAAKRPFGLERVSNPYWSELLAKHISHPALYGQRGANPDSHSQRLLVKMGLERTEKLRHVSRHSPYRAFNEEMAIAGIFQTILAALVYKVSGAEEFFLGITSHHRFDTSDTKTPGLFMNLIPVHTQVEIQETLESLFIRNRDESFKAIGHSSESPPPVDLLKSFNAVLNFVPGSFDSFGNVPVSCEWVHSGHSDPLHHIRLQVHDFGNSGEYELLFDFNQQVFVDVDQTEIPKHFLSLLDAFLMDPKQEIDRISIISPEAEANIDQWNNPYTKILDQETLLTKFEIQVEKSPDKIALWFRNESVTYRKLNQRANQFARLLQENNVKKGDVIAVSMERSISLMVAVYGLLKIGAVYMPLDTNIPQERLQFILDDSDALILVINHDRIKTEEVHQQVLHVEDYYETLKAQSTKRPDVKIVPEDIAYVIYTSGSTGKPKGVRCQHQGICNRLNWFNSEYPINAEDVVIFKTPIIFDVSLPEIFGPLQVGAQLVIEIPDGHKDTTQLLQTIRERNVSLVHFVPSMLGVFLDSIKATGCSGIKRVTCSGEALTASLVRKFHDTLDAELINLYGPTEASVEVSHWMCEKNLVETSIPIGFPGANTELYILDKYLKKVPVGVPGELHITGVQLAVDYINNPDQVAQKFIPNPFSSQHNARLYKTGDLARQRSDGAIQFLGRLDNQVKLRGFRIELGEIEAVLSAYPGVEQAVACLRSREDGYETLIGYYSGDPAESNNIKTFLSKRLPLYMIPSDFIHVEQFELTRSGKIDRRNLTNYKLTKDSERVEIVKPRNDLEHLVYDTWKEVLNISEFCIHDNFLGIGGDSLRALMIISRLKDALQLDLRSNHIFQYSSVELLAVAIEKMMIEIMEGN